MNPKIVLAIKSHLAAAEKMAVMAPEIERAAAALSGVVSSGGKILVCGNGGSAADSQHIAGELVGRFKKERRAIAAVALTTDTSILTCLSNDYSFERVFERQVEALGRRGDALVAISTSGVSANVLKAVEKASELGLFTLGLLGRGGGSIKPACDLALVIDETDTPRVQEMHLLCAHIICELIEDSAVS
ncbi:MAG: phosphoheptose isomerase [Elusimicrobia bacterium GWF2_52_66]|nr:MAG: phosphoheptose isomerase [Elusimicrobia bacterium GWA2_51_34]OGR85779.1 MAG: phosphoheptose isomerase [Elusimicrobia bacterium GWF2_52_66]HAF96262.1 phosphoheptose isomerase [Elusimicrobiota bacterium]HCE97448.1 phosphoheptose isomerase [Elusimicrobiota bacterium]